MYGKQSKLIPIVVGFSFHYINMLFILLFHRKKLMSNIFSLWKLWHFSEPGKVKKFTYSLEDSGCRASLHWFTPAREDRNGIIVTYHIIISGSLKVCSLYLSYLGRIYFVGPREVRYCNNQHPHPLPFISLPCGYEN